MPGASDTATFAGGAAETVLLGGNQAANGIVITATAGTQAIRASATGNILSLGTGGIQFGSTQTDLGGGGANAMVIALMGSQSWTGTGTGLIQLNNGGGVAQQSITNGTSGAVTLTFDGAGTGGKTVFGVIDNGSLGGTTAITMNAGGTLTLFGNNTYSGGTTFTQGALNLQNNTALGTGALNFVSNANAKTISSSLLGGITLNNNPLNFNGTGAIILAGNQNIDFGTGAITLGSATILSFNNQNVANTYTFGGPITGSFGITVQSASSNISNSILALNGANTGNSAAAPITINGTAPTVKFGNTNAVPTGTGAVVLNGGAIAVGTGTAFSTIASFLSDTRVTKTSGAIALTGDSSENFTAPNANISVGAAAGSVARYTGTLTANGANSYNVGGGGGTIVFTNANAFTGARGLETNSGNNNTAGNVAFGAGGITVITGQNTFTGANGGVAIGAGTLEVSSINSVVGGTATSNLGAPTSAANGTINLGYSGQAFSELRYTGLGETTDRTLNFNGFSGASIGLDASGTGAVNFGGAYTQANNSTNRFLSLRGINTGANTFAGGIGTTNNPGAVNLTKVQRGNWTLTGTNNFAATNASTSGIQINGGTLTADYTTNPNILGATGTNLTLNGGTLAMVNNGAGTATQTVGNGATTPLTTLTANTGQSNVNVTGNGTAGSAVLTFGSNFTRNGNTYLNFNLLNGGQVASTTAAMTNSVVTGSSNVAAFTVTDAVGTDFATLTGGQIAKLNAATALPASGSSSTTNYVLSGNQTLTASESINSLRIDTTGGTGTLALGANSLTATTLGLLKTGTNDYNITGTRLAPAAGTIVLEVYGAGALNVASAITDGNNGSVTKTGPGLLNVTGAQTYGGQTTIAGGVMRFSNTATGTGLIVLNTGGILELGADLNGAAAGDFSRQLGTGATQLQWGNGDGGFSAAGGDRAVSLTNNLGIAGGQLAWGSTSGNNATIVANSTNNLFVKDGQALLLSSSVATGTLDFQNPIDLVNMSRAVVVGDGTSAVDAILSGVLSSSDYSGGVEKSGAGTLALTAANTYTGQTRILGGTLQIGNAGTSGTLGTGGAVVDNGALVFKRTDAAPAVSNIISGTGTVTQAGTGTTILTGANTYTGATAVTAGTLAVNGSTAAGSAVSVAAAGTLTGTGTVAGTVSDSGKINPGAVGAVGTLTTGALTFNSASSLVLDYGGNAVDKLFSASSINNLGNATLSFNNIGGAGLSLAQYVLVDGSNTLSTLPTVSGSVPTGYTLGFSGGDLVLNQVTTTATSYTLAASAGASNLRVGATTGVTSTITNTGTGTADGLTFTGLGATPTTGSTTSGTIAPGASSSNSGLTFTAAAVGSQTITPTVTSATNSMLGGNATLTGTTTASVNVYSGQTTRTGTGGNYVNGTNATVQAQWADGGAPGIDGPAFNGQDTAGFTGNGTVTINVTPDLKTLSLGGGTTLASDGTHGLTLDGGAGSATVTVSGTGNNVQAPVTFATGGAVSVASNSSLALGQVNGASGTTVSLGGGTTLTLAPTVSATPPDGSAAKPNDTFGALSVTGGTATLDFGALGAGGGTFTFLTTNPDTFTGVLNIINYTGNAFTFPNAAAPDGLDELFFAAGVEHQLQQVYFINPSGNTGVYQGRLLSSGEVVAPEPSQWAALLVGALGLGGLSLKARRRTAQAA